MKMLMHWLAEGVRFGFGATSKINKLNKVVISITTQIGGT
jgi:hypothetical protein